MAAVDVNIGSVTGVPGGVSGVSGVQPSLTSPPPQRANASLDYTNPRSWYISTVKSKLVEDFVKERLTTTTTTTTTTLPEIGVPRFARLRRLRRRPKSGDRVRLPRISAPPGEKSTASSKEDDDHRGDDDSTTTSTTTKEKTTTTTTLPRGILKKRGAVSSAELRLLGAGVEAALKGGVGGVQSGAEVSTGGAAVGISFADEVVVQEVEVRGGGGGVGGGVKDSTPSSTEDEEERSGDVFLDASDDARAGAFLTELPAARDFGEAASMQRRRRRSAASSSGSSVGFAPGIEDRSAPSSLDGVAAAGVVLPVSQPLVVIEEASTPGAPASKERRRPTSEEERRKEYFDSNPYRIFTTVKGERAWPEEGRRRGTSEVPEEYQELVMTPRCPADVNQKRTPDHERLKLRLQSTLGVRRGGGSGGGSGTSGGAGPSDAEAVARAASASLPVEVARRREKIKWAYGCRHEEGNIDVSHVSAKVRCWIEFPSPVGGRRFRLAQETKAAPRGSASSVSGVAIAVYGVDDDEFCGGVEGGGDRRKPSQFSEWHHRMAPAEEDGRSSGTYMKIASPDMKDEDSEDSEGRFIYMAPQDGYLLRDSQPVLSIVNISVEDRFLYVTDPEDLDSGGVGGVASNAATDASTLGPDKKGRRFFFRGKEVRMSSPARDVALSIPMAPLDSIDSHEELEGVGVSLEARGGATSDAAPPAPPSTPPSPTHHTRRKTPLKSFKLLQVFGELRQFRGGAGEGDGRGDGPDGAALSMAVVPARPASFLRPLEELDAQLEVHDGDEDPEEAVKKSPRSSSLPIRPPPSNDPPPPPPWIKLDSRPVHKSEVLIRAEEERRRLAEARGAKKSAGSKKDRSAAASGAERSSGGGVSGETMATTTAPPTPESRTTSGAEIRSGKKFARSRESRLDQQDPDRDGLDVNNLLQKYEEEEGGEGRGGSDIYHGQRGAFRPSRVIHKPVPPRRTRKSKQKNGDKNKDKNNGGKNNMGKNNGGKNNGGKKSADKNKGQKQ